MSGVISLPADEGGGLNLLDQRLIKKSRQGFTLVEIFLVIVLLSMTAALAIPQLNLSYQQMQLQTTASDIAYLMRYAQNRAMLEQRMVRLKFSADFSQYGLLEAKAEAGNDSQEPDFVRITGRQGKIFRVPEAITVQGEKPELNFLPDGTMEKTSIKICYKAECFIVSTKHQRGAVHVVETLAEDSLPVFSQGQETQQEGY